MIEKIAWRYLKMKKSHGAVSAVAAVAVVGVAVATAALVCVLSVFNGFRAMLTEQNDKILPDIEVATASGRVIENGDSLAAALRALPGVELASPIIAEQALAIYNSQEMPVTLRGIIEEDFRKITQLDSLLVASAEAPVTQLSASSKTASAQPSPEDYEAFEPLPAKITVGVAYRLGLFRPGETLFLFAPRREGRLNPANPLGSFFTDSVRVSAIAETRQNEIDLNSVYVPLELARNLFQYDTQASAIYIKVSPDDRKGNTAAEKELNTASTDRIAAVAAGIAAKLGDDYSVKDRARQQAMNFRMVEIEKWITALLLVFILIIASFNIISTMTMLILEKRRSMRILRALGMSRRRVGAIFAVESFYITLIGAAAGLLLGVLLCLLQQHFGLITVAGASGESAIPYPVAVEWSDLALILIPTLLISLATSLIAAGFARSRSAQTHQ